MPGSASSRLPTQGPRHQSSAPGRAPPQSPERRHRHDRVAEPVREAHQARFTSPPARSPVAFTVASPRDVLPRHHASTPARKGRLATRPPARPSRPARGGHAATQIGRACRSPTAGRAPAPGETHGVLLRRHEEARAHRPRLTRVTAPRSRACTGGDPETPRSPRTIAPMPGEPPPRRSGRRCPRRRDAAALDRVAGLARARVEGPRGPRTRSPPRAQGDVPAYCRDLLEEMPARFRARRPASARARCARARADGGSRSVPRGKGARPGPTGARASRHTISDVLQQAPPAGSRRRAAPRPAGARHRPPPGRETIRSRPRPPLREAGARSSGSSPARRPEQPRRAAVGHEPTGAPGRRPYAAARWIATRRPSSVSQRATISTAGVLPVPPTAGSPRRPPAHGSRPRASHLLAVGGLPRAIKPRPIRPRRGRQDDAAEAGPRGLRATRGASRPRRTRAGLSSPPAPRNGAIQPLAPCSAPRQYALQRGHRCRDAPWWARTAPRPRGRAPSRAGRRREGARAPPPAPRPSFDLRSPRPRGSRSAAASRKFVMCGPEDDRLRVERRLHHVVAADRHQAAPDEDDVGDGVERRQLAHRVEQDHRGRAPGADPAPSDDGEAAALGRGSRPRRAARMARRRTSRSPSACRRTAI